MKLKQGACPKCSGDMLDEHDQYGDYAKCIHCGYVQYPCPAAPTMPLTDALETCSCGCGQYL